MAIEKFWSPVGPISVTSNGNAYGYIQILSVRGLFVKQDVLLKSGTDEFHLEIKEIPNSTTIRLGPRSQPLKTYSDLSTVLLANSPTIEAERQSRSNIPEKEFIRATYAEEPIVAWRNILVDEYGNFHNKQNPLQVELSNGSISIGTVNAELEVQLSHQDGEPDSGDVADSVQIGDGFEILQINPDGSINIVPLVVTTPHVININVVNADTEYSWPIPANTKRYKFRIRDGKAKAKLSYSVGTSGTEYWTVERGAWDGESDIDASSGLTLYFQATNGNCVAEIQYWTR